MRNSWARLRSRAAIDQHLQNSSPFAASPVRHLLTCTATKCMAAIDSRQWWPTRSKQKLKTGDSCLIATAGRFANSVLEWACSQQKKSQIISEHEDFLINELDTACQVIEPGDIVVTGADQDKARVVLQVFTLTPFLCYSNAIIIFPRACPSSE